MKKQLFRRGALILGIGFIFALFYHSRKDLVGYFESAEWTLLLISVLIGTVGYIASGSFFKQLLSKHGEPISAATSRKLLLLSQAAKYIPGRVWPIAHQAAMLGGANSIRSLTISNIEFIVLSMIMVTTVSIAILGQEYTPALAIFVLLSGAFVFVLVTESCAFSKAMLISARFLKLTKLTEFSCQRPANAPLTLAFFVLYTCTYTASNVLMMISVFNISPGDAATYLSFLGIAWIVGSISMITPSGIGIKEAVFVFIAQRYASTPDPAELISIALVSRFWTIAQELAGIAYVLIEERIAMWRKGAPV